MLDNYFESKTYSKLDFTKSNLVKGEYDNCTFLNCNFDAIHASNIEFIECEFIECNFSNTIVKYSAFKDVNFEKCKMIGVKFFECNPFLLQIKFKNCQLNLSSFYQLKMPKSQFLNCTLQEVDFTESDLSGAIFDNCDLKMAVFNRSNIEKADLETSFSFKINPEENKINGAKFSKDNVIGLLSQYKIVIQ